MAAAAAALTPLQRRPRLFRPVVVVGDGGRGRDVRHRRRCAVGSPAAVCRPRDDAGLLVLAIVAACVRFSAAAAPGLTLPLPHALRPLQRGFVAGLLGIGGRPGPDLRLGPGGVVEVRLEQNGPPPAHDSWHPLAHVPSYSSPVRRYTHIPGPCLCPRRKRPVFTSLMDVPANVPWPPRATGGKKVERYSCIVFWTVYNLRGRAAQGSIGSVFCLCLDSSFATTQHEIILSIS